MNLEQELRTLAIEFPPEPDLTGAVLARLERPRRRLWLAPVIAALAAVAALLAIPQTRAAILDFFRIGGETIERVETQPRAPQRAPVTGAEVTLAKAREEVAFEPLVPDEPARVYVDRNVPGGMVSFVWNGLVLSEFEGEQVVEKFIGPGTRTTSYSVRGEPGLWLEGAPHAVMYVGKDGEFRELTRRLAGNVLVWTSGSVTYRLEGARSAGQALEIARNLSRS